MDVQTTDRPASGATRYRITVRGRLTGFLASAFDGMGLESAAGETTLTGDLVDQAQLYGLIERLRDLGLDLVSVERVP